MIELSGLDAACKDAQKAGKYVVLIDRTDKAADYFSYSA
jgi:ABC-type sugar transport system substrate-binding protein